MEHKNNYQLLVLIATHKLSEKASELFIKHSLPIQYFVTAEGTASSDIMDMLGLVNTDKCLIVSTVKKDFGEYMLKLLHTELSLDTKGSGIAFTMPLTGANNLLIKMMSSTEELLEIRKDYNIMNMQSYVLITAVVNRGFSTDVMDAARPAGARGGTVVHSRSIESPEANALWGIGSNEEKEFVLIITDAEKKLDVMNAISKSCGVHSKAQGLVFSLPIDSVMGI